MKPEPTPLPEPAGRLTGCHDDDLDGVHGYTAGQMRDAMSARDAAWQARRDALVAQERERADILQAALLDAMRVVAKVDPKGFAKWASTQGGGSHG